MEIIRVRNLGRLLLSLAPLIGVLALFSSVLSGAGTTLRAVSKVRAERTVNSQRSNDQWIQAAISLGSSSAPEPYVLRDAWRHENAIGLLYTPFLRVAMAARDAAAAGHTLAVSELSPELTEPVIYVCLRRFESSHSREADEAGAAILFSVVTADSQPDGEGIQPAWTRKLSSLPPQLRVTLRLPVDSNEERLYHPVAAFPVDAIRAGRDFVVYQKWRGPGGSDRLWQLRARISDGDARDWR